MPVFFLGEGLIMECIYLRQKTCLYKKWLWFGFDWIFWSQITNDMCIDFLFLPFELNIYTYVLIPTPMQLRTPWLALGASLLHISQLSSFRSNVVLPLRSLVRAWSSIMLNMVLICGYDFTSICNLGPSLTLPS